MTDLVIGYGEVGSALAEILNERCSVDVLDPQKGMMPADDGDFYEWVHICIPYGEGFVDAVLDTIKGLPTTHLVIHSTVAVGTTAEIADGVPHDTWVYYSPVRGIHPHLGRYIREFPKWFSPPVSGQPQKDFEEHFGLCGIQTRVVDSYDILEWAKLWETTEYGYRIAMWQEVGRQARTLPSTAVDTLKEFLFEKRKVYDGDRGIAPIMYDGIIGGHCVMPNLELMAKGKGMTQEFYDWLVSSNERRKRKRWPHEKVRKAILGQT